MPDVKCFAFVVSDLYGEGAEKSLLFNAEGLQLVLNNGLLIDTPCINSDRRIKP